MKLPNGYGSVSKLSGRRRRPYMVRMNKRIIAYCKTRQEGLAILADYHKKPWDIDRSKTTFAEVFDLLIKTRAGQVGDKTIREYKSKYRKCEDLYNIPYKEIRTYHFTTLIEEKEKTPGSKNNLKKLFRAMDKVAYEYDIIAKKYSDNIPVYQSETVIERIPFSEKEIKVLWNNLGKIEDVDLVLILIYLGMRPAEFTDLKIADIDFKTHFLRGGNKTKAGRNRKIPIHPKIEPLIKSRIELAKKDTLLNYGYKRFRERFVKVMEKLKMSHVPHECRHTLRTRLDNNNINPNIINLILGHQGQGVGERVYTHKTNKQLYDAILTLD